MKTLESLNSTKFQKMSTKQLNAIQGGKCTWSVARFSDGVKSRTVCYENGDTSYGNYILNDGHKNGDLVR